MDDFLPEMEPDGEYYSCSNKQEHAENCIEIDEMHPATEFGYSRLWTTSEGKEFGCQTVTKWDVAIAIERKKWRELNLDPNVVTFSLIEMKAQISALIELLTEETFTKEKMDEVFQIRLLRIMAQAREDILPSVQEMRRRAIAAPAMPQGLIGPDGKPIIFHD